MNELENLLYKQNQIDKEYKCRIERIETRE